MRMHAVLNPDRVLICFVYVGAAVESITVAGAARAAAARGDLAQLKSGGKLIAAGQDLQAVVERIVLSLVVTFRRRVARAGDVPRNVKIVCYTLYVTSTLVLMRCIFRAVENFETFNHLACTANCGAIISDEWFLYAFELGPMLIFTYWLNLLHPGRFLPREKIQYLGVDRQTESYGPGWVDHPSRLATYLDPLNIVGSIKGERSHDQYWLRDTNFRVAVGSFAAGTASNKKTGQTPGWQSRSKREVPDKV
ncbi:hypothetical protein N7468_007087 [Penicillium chermesinum]|uniref:Uncharacterized protein n=1 Tax=Penicillium chermesinum TaxID=63820 RepID=A0A9W9NTI6_9EURO|nr:uncharacterized protein N7468_007087 [Penicillium chermesinum]KAJ5225862.1 hypothetical protein N7468_007087 [Penicillium chermesinum]KAJ6160934.1 hypothetical protein N7470_004330 [Penicillium chermesinum]